MYTKNFRPWAWFFGGCLAAFLLMGGYTFVKKIGAPPTVQKKIPESFHTNIFQATQTNANYRHVLFTGLHSQLVVMNIPPGTEVGAETHKYVEQTLFFLSGSGTGELNGKQFPVGPGDVVVVVPGTEHNFVNTGKTPLKIYTVYAPPNHFDGLIEATKAEADANTADEAIGEQAPVCAP